MQQKPKQKSERIVKDKFRRGPINITPKTDMQGQYLKALRESDQVLVFGPAGCKSGDTIINYRRGKRNSSRPLTLKEFVSKFNGGTNHNGANWDLNLDTYVQSIDQATGKLFYNKVEGAWYTGVKESVRISTDQSGHVDITLDDSVLLEDGTFKKVGEVKVGDKLLCKGSMVCASSGSRVKHDRKKKRVVVEGLKYYSGGWNKFVKEGDKVYHYKRNHKARLVIEAAEMNIPYDQYIYDLKNNPNHSHTFILQKDLEVHHINGDCSDDRLENLEVLSKVDHAERHGDENSKNFNRQWSKVSEVISVEPLGEIEVYDLTMEAPWHNFVVNDGIIAHNTGKTFIAASYAADQYAQNYINKIIITRPHVAVGKELGFLKGDILEKTLPWALPVLDVLEEHLGKDTVESAIRNGNIEVAPLALMRGRSFKNAMVIVDESQNITFEELKMLLTRVGEDTTIVINGDIKQSDLKGADGLSKIVHLTKKHMLPIPIIEFTIDDVVRSDMVKMWLTVFDKENL